MSTEASKTKPSPDASNTDSSATTFQSPYSILHNILYLHKHDIQNPTQRIRNPVRDCFQKDWMRCVVRVALKHVEKYCATLDTQQQQEEKPLNQQKSEDSEKQEESEHKVSNESSDVKKEDNSTGSKEGDSKTAAHDEDDDDIDSTKTSLNTHIKDLKEVSTLCDEDAFCEEVYQTLLKYYDTESAGEQKESVMDDETPNTDIMDVSTTDDAESEFKPSQVVITLKEKPFINPLMVQTSNEITYTYTKAELMQKLHELYQKMMQQYTEYTSTVYVSNIGELPSQNLTAKDEKHHKHYRVKKHTVTLITETSEFWNIDANIKSVGGDTVLGRELQFRHIRNDGQVAHLKLLNSVKFIYSKQLPNMPKHYISRLVFDRTHRSMLAIKNGAVVGGITYKPFDPQGFAEIAFVAVDASLQVKQCGTKLMNNLKNHFKKEGKIWRFLTFADNSAVGFFKKMGFSKDITIPNWRYSSYIKYYTDVSLMECVLRPGIPYLRTKEWVTKQEEIVQEHAKIQEKRRKQDPENYILQAKPSRQHHGLYFNSKGNLYNKYKGSRIKRIEDVPGLKNARGLLPLPSEDDLNKLRKKLTEVWQEVYNHKDAHIFHHPVDRTIEDYYQIVKHPVDLSLIKTRLDKLYYRHVEMFVADFKRLFDNCRLYNEQTDLLYNMANNCDRFFQEKMREKGLNVEKVKSEES